MASESTWPPSSGLSTRTVSRSDAILTLAASITISAPAEQVFATILDTSTYPSWCTFVPRVGIKSQPSGVDSSSQILHLGTSFTFYAVMDSSKPNKEAATNLHIMDISTPEKQSEYIPKDVLESDRTYTADLGRVYRVAWGGHEGFFTGVLRFERFHEIIVTGQNECEVRNWEIMGGILAHAVKWLYKDTLQKKFEDWNRELKAFCEKDKM
ncbi:hypothetical protein BU23DRAFT_86520 [Bimuria novae-zelandiae CBS 107.79]|uniref:Coenzyme Q-binding protein COQ10 START domain-containing protein n=1 Tax=Bimuria novae-zelandiae CBS 107.79 TaxID=1447943 RepID=A0A6A5VD54_9PLEO|nr:hypothetical protein BU23DRAFT_86520 [Bimuria novae-zelandiae CBS 107.79]